MPTFNQRLVRIMLDGKKGVRSWQNQEHCD